MGTRGPFIHQNFLRVVLDRGGAAIGFDTGNATFTAGLRRIHLAAANHQVIGSSQMYASQASSEGGIASVKTNGCTTTVKDNT